jgi:hypothetical protein
MMTARPLAAVIDGMQEAWASAKPRFTALSVLAMLGLLAAIRRQWYEGSRVAAEARKVSAEAEEIELRVVGLREASTARPTGFPPASAAADDVSPIDETPIPKLKSASNL